MGSALAALGVAFTDISVEQSAFNRLDFPVGRCGGHAQTGVAWSAPAADRINISGAAWKFRQSDSAYLSLWVKDRQVIKHVQVFAASRKPSLFERMLADQAGDPKALQAVAVAPGDVIIVQIEGNDFVGLDLTITGGTGKWNLAADFSDEENPCGPWSYGRVLVEQGKPKLVPFKAHTNDFDPADFASGQPAWHDTESAWYWSLMKRRPTAPVFGQVRYTSGKTVYLESLMDGHWAGRFWASDGRINIAYERWTHDAFELEVDNQLVAGGWRVVSASELPKNDKGARHFIVELSRGSPEVAVKVHTLVDGTPILTRWLEIANASDKPLALTSIYPWSSLLLANATFWGEPNPPKRFDQPFSLGYFKKVDHCWEGWFDWKPLPAGKTVIGCDRGQCYDDPFFILKNEGTGEFTIGSLAYSANWRMELDYKQEGSHQLRFKIGPWATTALRVLAPGETVTTPALHMGVIAGSFDSAVQAMHDHVRQSVLPRRRPERAYLVQYSVPGDQGYLSERFGDPSGYTEESVIKNIDLAAALGSELFIMDAGWWDHQGDWWASPARFPRGLAPLADYCHKKRMLFGLYGEIEKASAESKVAKEHPDWIEWYKPYPILNLARPEVARWMEGQLCEIIEKNKLDLWRLDFNTPTSATFEGATSQCGTIKENNFWRYYDAFYGVFDRIHAKYPDLILQQAACGGGRNDLGTAARFHEQYLTDGLRVPYEIQNYCGQTLALPPETFIIAHGADGGGGVGHAENLETNLRILYTLSTPWLFAGIIGPSVAEMNPVRTEQFHHYSELYKQFIRPLLPTCKVYHHTPVSADSGVESSGWFAMEYAAPERTKGWATLIRIGKSNTPEYHFRPRGLDPRKSYHLTVDSLGSTVPVTGWELMREGIPVRLETLGSSELLLFEAR
jgi:alpha-galactosidase